MRRRITLREVEDALTDEPLSAGALFGRILGRGVSSTKADRAMRRAIARIGLELVERGRAVGVPYDASSPSGRKGDVRFRRALPSADGER